MYQTSARNEVTEQIWMLVSTNKPFLFCKLMQSGKKAWNKFFDAFGQVSWVRSHASDRLQMALLRRLLKDGEIWKTNQKETYIFCSRPFLRLIHLLSKFWLLHWEVRPVRIVIINFQTLLGPQKDPEQPNKVRTWNIPVFPQARNNTNPPKPILKTKNKAKPNQEKFNNHFAAETAKTAPPTRPRGEAHKTATPPGEVINFPRNAMWV